MLPLTAMLTCKDTKSQKTYFSYVNTVASVILRLWRKNYNHINTNTVARIQKYWKSAFLWTPTLKVFYGGVSILNFSVQEFEVESI